MAIDLPVDANGMTVPLDTTMMYREGGEQFHVTDFFYEAKPDKWFARNGSRCVVVSTLYLDTYEKDSLKQLAADLDRVVKRKNGNVPMACAYLNRCDSQCINCKFIHSHVNCIYLMLADIAARVHSLCGDAE